MTVLGGGGFGRWLGHEGGVIVSGISASIKEAPLTFLASCEVVRKEGPLCIRRLTHQNLTMLTPPPSHTSELWKLDLCCLSCPVCGIFIIEAWIDKVLGKVQKVGRRRRGHRKREFLGNLSVWRQDRRGSIFYAFSAPENLGRHPCLIIGCYIGPQIGGQSPTLDWRGEGSSLESHTSWKAQGWAGTGPFCKLSFSGRGSPSFQCLTLALHLLCMCIHLWSHPIYTLAPWLCWYFSILCHDYSAN